MVAGYWFVVSGVVTPLVLTSQEAGAAVSDPTLSRSVFVTRKRDTEIARDSNQMMIVRD